jgi:hypothetical protein
MRQSLRLRTRAANGDKIRLNALVYLYAKRIPTLKRPGLPVCEADTYA